MAADELAVQIEARRVVDAIEAEHRRSLVEAPGSPVIRDGQKFNVGETFAGLPYGKGVELADMLKPLVPGRAPMAQFALTCTAAKESTLVFTGTPLR